MNAALKYILGTKSEIIIDGKKFFQTKYKTLSTEQLNHTINELMFTQFEKIGYGQVTENFIRNAYEVYKEAKSQRSALDMIDKIAHKSEWEESTKIIIGLSRLKLENPSTIRFVFLMDCF